jgi:competence protein ComEA
MRAAGAWAPSVPASNDVLREDIVEHGGPDRSRQPPEPAEPSGATLGRRRRVLDLLGDRLPVGLRAAVVAPSGPALAALAVVLAMAVAVGAGCAWLTRPQETPIPALRRTGGSSGLGADVAGGPAAAVDPPAATSTAVAIPPAAAGATSSPTGTVVVHVVGAVHRPGLVTLPAGSRVADAVESAGGATAGAALVSVNLARLLVDGEQIVVLRHGQVAGPGVAAPGPPPGGAGPGGGPSGAGSSLPVDLNTATLEQLDGLPGIGPVLARRILDWRTAHGRFESVDDLGEVSGIGERTLAELRPQVRV